MKYGYMRVAETGSSIEEQTKLLLANACDRLFTDVTQDNKSSNDALDDWLKLVVANDVIVVMDLSRFNCTLKELIELLTSLFERGVILLSVEENIDSSVKNYHMTINNLKALLKFEQHRVREKNKIGLRSARARGKLGGRPRKLDGSRAAMAKSLYRDKKHSIVDICGILGVSKATLYRYLK